MPEQGLLDQMISRLLDPASRAGAILDLQSGYYASTLNTDVVNMLVAKLADPAAADQAAFALSYWRDARAYDTLVSLLGSEDAALRAEAAASLGRMADSHARDPLIQVLQNDGDERARVEAATALGSLPSDRTALAALTGALSDGSPLVRRQAAYSLGVLGASDRVDELTALLQRDPDSEVRRYTVHALALLGAVDPLLLVVREGTDANMVTTAIALLGQLKDKMTEAQMDSAETALGRRLSDNDPNIRMWAAYSLATLGITGKADDIARILERDRDATVRSVALIALGMMGEIDPILSALRNDSDANVRANAVAWLFSLQGSMNEAQARAYGPALNAALTDDSPLVRTYAIRTLAALGVTDAANEIANVVRRDSDPAVRMEATAAVGRLGSASELLDLLHDSRDSGVRNTALMWLNQMREGMGEEDRGTLYGEAQRIASRTDASTEERINAMLVLQYSTDRQAGVLLLSLLGNDELRETALLTSFRWVSQNGMPEGVSAFNMQQYTDELMGYLSNTDANLRRSAAYLLGTSRAEGAVDSLITILQNEQEDPQVRIAAARALGRIGGEAAITALIETGANGQLEEPLRAAANSALGRLGTESAQLLATMLWGSIAENNSNASAIAVLLTGIMEGGQTPNLNLPTGYHDIGTFFSGYEDRIKGFLDGLVNLLQDEDANVRRSAAVLLGALPTCSNLMAPPDYEMEPLRQLVVTALQARLETETDESVRSAISGSVDRLSSGTRVARR